MRVGQSLLLFLEKKTGSVFGSEVVSMFKNAL